MAPRADFPLVPLGQVLADIKDGTHGTHARTGAGIPFLSAKNISEEGKVVWTSDDDRISEHEYHSIHRHFRLQPNDVLLTIVGSIGRRAIFDGSPVTFQRSVAYLRPVLSRLDPRYLFHATGTAMFQQALKQRSNATAQAGLYLGELAQILVALPMLAEQRRIAEILDTLDETIHKTEQIIAKLKRMKQGLLHDLLTRGIDENGELRDPERHPELFRKTKLGTLPSAWRIIRLHQLAVVSGGVTLGRTLSGPGTIVRPYLRVANVQDGFLDLSEIKFVRILASEEERFSIRAGDVLMNEGGDYDKLGRGAVWRSQIPGCLHQNHVFRVRPGPHLRSDFLAAVTASVAGKSYFLRASKQTTNLASINSTQIKAMPIPVPDPPEQARIEVQLKGVEARVTGEETGLMKFRQLKHGLMEDLLTGRVRVTNLLNEVAA